MTQSPACNRAAELASRELCIYRQAIEMIEPVAARPRRQLLFSRDGERFLKTGNGFSALGISRRHDAALAGIHAKPVDVADAKRHGRPRRTYKAVLPKRFDAGDFEICAEAAARFVEREAGEPAGDFLERRGAEERGARGVGVVGEAAGRCFRPDRK